jgi:hypothetical protein
MLGDAAVKDSPPLMLDHEEHEQNPQADRGYKEKIDRCDLPDVILQECPPGLRRWPLEGPQDARNGPLRNRDSELLQLAVNAWRPLQGISLGHSSNQRPNLDRNGRSSESCGPLRQTRPVPAEAFSLPAYHRVGVNNDQGFAPVLPPGCERHPEPAEAPG